MFCVGLSNPPAGVRFRLAFSLLVLDPDVVDAGPIEIPTAEPTAAPTARPFVPNETAEIVKIQPLDINSE